MGVNKIITKVDGIESKVLDFSDLISGLNAGSHNITVEAYDGNTLLNSQTKNFTITGTSSYEAETDAFSTASGITDTAQLDALDNTIKYYKAQNVWSIITTFHPMLGTTATQRGYNAKDTNAFNMTFFGGWTFNSTGNVGAANTYAKCGFSPSANWTSNIGVSLAQSVKGGSGQTIAGSELLYLTSNQAAGKSRWMPGSFNESYEVPHASGIGIFTGVNIGGVHELLINQTSKFSIAASAGKAATEWHYGNTFYNGNLLGSNTGSLSSQILFNPASTAQAITIAEGQRQLEVALGRLS